MVSNLPTALDNLASSGIIDFDADAYVKGTPARYVGNPDPAAGYLPFDQPLPAFPAQYGPAPQLPAQPRQDAFVTHNKEEGLPSWKKALAVVVLGGFAVLAGVKHKDKITKFLKSTWTKLKTVGKNLTAPTPPPAPKPAPVAAKSKFKIPKWAKVTGIGLGSLLVVGGIYKFLSSEPKK